MLGLSDTIQVIINHACQASVLEDSNSMVIKKDGEELVLIKFPDWRKMKYRIYDLDKLFNLLVYAVERVRSYKKEEK